MPDRPRLHAARTAMRMAATIALAAAASDAVASFHIAHISRVMTGHSGSTDLQYVEIVMDAAGQNLVAGSKLVAFGADGAFSHVVLTVPANVKSGIVRPWIMATASFKEASAVDPDFVFDAADGKGLPPKAGMVCWGKPSDEADPDDPNMIDCVSYGDYTGPANGHTSAPTPLMPFGHGLVQVATTGSSATDFACEDPAKPRNNTPATGTIFATSPCTGCGSGVAEDGEECDDGDPSFTPGDYCSATCQAFACGIPTSSTATTPKTSDALFVLRAAVGVSNCDLRVCDASGNGSVASSDSLLILKKAVGQDVALACPAAAEAAGDEAP